MSDPIHILSLGAGVQSSTMALMAAKGELTPMPKAAIFADTQAEPASVYRWLDWLEGQLPFPVYRVTAGSLTEQITRVQTNRKGEKLLRKAIPLFVDTGGGTEGKVMRDCTADFKVKPLRAKQREIARVRRGEKAVKVISWIGISLDEVSRMKPSRDHWCEHRWPLVESRMTRHDCLLWMQRNGYSAPPRSACVYCPFHSNAEWRRLRSEEHDGFLEAVRVEKAIQRIHAYPHKGQIKGQPYLHRSLIPLDEVDLSTLEDRGQLNFFNNECEGMCGV